MADVDVLICGLGPVGQLLALLLGDRGVDVLAIDRLEAPYPLPRAAVIDDEVLRIFQGAGLDAQILADSQVQPRASIVTAGGRPVEILSASSGPLGHPPLVSINQPAIEATMLDALAHRPSVRVRRGVTLESIRRHPDRVEVELSTDAGAAREELSARWLIGCDGGGSAVRRQLGIAFTGTTAPQRWIVVDALVPVPLSKVPHPHFVGRAERPIVTLPMSPGRHRWEWMLHPGEDEAPFLEPAAVRDAVAEWLEPANGETAEIERAVVYTFHTRMADRWRDGRVLLAGDAAHVMPPFAGQGFSSGARDAMNLAWKLAAVLEGAPDSLLDSYEQERRPHVAAMARLANVVGGFVQATSPARVRTRDLALTAIDGTPVQRLIATQAKPLPTYAAGAFSRRPRRLAPARTVGSLFPQSDRLDDRLPSGWVALSADAAIRATFTAAGIPAADPGADGAWLDRHRVAFALLRPDRFVFAAGGGHSIGQAIAAWRAITHHHTTQGANMVSRIGHIALHVADLDTAVEFQRAVIGMVETERRGNRAYLTCNDRHHELVLIEDPARRGYAHIGLEVPDAATLDTAARQLTNAGGTVLGPVQDGGPGIERALSVRSPAGHVYKLFAGMETVTPPPAGDRPSHFEHVSCKVLNHRAEERFLTQGLGMKFSDRMGFLASWWHCNEDHHGIALTLAPRAELSHYAYSWPDLSALGRAADRLKAHAGRKCIWGPSRHGPGNNHFLYFHDADGAMIENCSELAQIQRDGYVPKRWSMNPGTINQWGGPPPLRFLLTGYPISGD